MLKITFSSRSINFSRKTIKSRFSLCSTVHRASTKKKSIEGRGETLSPPKSHHQSCWTREKSWHSDFGVGVFCIAEFLFFPPEISTTRNLSYILSCLFQTHQIPNQMAPIRVLKRNQLIKVASKSLIMDML